MKDEEIPLWEVWGFTLGGEWTSEFFEAKDQDEAEEKARGIISDIQGSQLARVD